MFHFLYKCVIVMVQPALTPCPPRKPTLAVSAPAIVQKKQ
jgi:hypothetical protein